LVLEKKIKSSTTPVAAVACRPVEAAARDDRDITFLHLATHTSSLAGSARPGLVLLSFWGARWRTPTPIDSAAVAKTLRENQLPRPICSKQNTQSPVACWSCTARVDGADSYEALLAKRILRPLGMEECHPAVGEQKKKLAPGHDGSGKPASGWNFATLEAVGASAPTSATCCCSWSGDGEKPTPPQAGFAFAQQPWRTERQGRSRSPLLDAIIQQPGSSSLAQRRHRWLRLLHGFRQKSGMGVVVLCNGAERAVDDLV